MFDRARWLEEPQGSTLKRVQSFVDSVPVYFDHVKQRRRLSKECT